MEKYHNYLLQLGLRVSTVEQHWKFLRLFLGWLRENNLRPDECDYEKMVKFVDHAMIYFQAFQNPGSAINRMIVSISYYYDMMSLDNIELKNPAKTIRMKTRKGKLVSDLLEHDEYREIFNSYEANTARNVRNKVLLGFIVFQALTTEDLHKLRLEDLHLREGTVYIREARSNGYKKGLSSRVLKLESSQIIDIIEYINEIRPRILAGSYSYLPGRKPHAENLNFRTDQLLLSIHGSTNLKASIHHLFRVLKLKNPRIINGMHIRQSVISHWLRIYDIRMVQYMSGHRYVSSTEHYKQIDIEDLKRDVLQFHPLN